MLSERHGDDLSVYAETEAAAAHAVVLQKNEEVGQVQCLPAVLVERGHGPSYRDGRRTARCVVVDRHTQPIRSALTSLGTRHELLLRTSVESQQGSLNLWQGMAGLLRLKQGVSCERQSLVVVTTASYGSI